MSNLISNYNHILWGKLELDLNQGKMLIEKQ